MITHNPEAAAIANRILYVRDGEIVREEKGRRPAVGVSASGTV
jgi:putative ABC transport system ATP-binding protein